MVKKTRVVLDTNILISAFGFGGKPRDILYLIFEEQLQAISSPILLAELDDVIFKKFPKLASQLDLIHTQLKKNFTIVRPKLSFHIVRNEPDNRVLEAAVEGDCDYIITGDRDLLALKTFKDISILKPDDFLSIVKE